jgi:DNA integrity scanning protein DisA with diadenylate cyclase activity
VAYGGRHASATDVSSARAAWPSVVEQAGDR